MPARFLSASLAAREQRILPRRRQSQRVAVSPISYELTQPAYFFSIADAILFRQRTHSHAGSPLVPVSQIGRRPQRSYI